MMIQKLQNTDIEVSKKIHSVFQASYAVEAKILKAVDFPPLKRTLENYRASNTAFFGCIKNGELAGVIEIDQKDDHTRIASLVIDPRFFRQGIASQLIKYVFNSYDSDIFMVETGVDNGPATELYKKYGFIEVKQWDTDFGIQKIRFERR